MTALVMRILVYALFSFLPLVTPQELPETFRLCTKPAKGAYTSNECTLYCYKKAGRRLLEGAFCLPIRPTFFQCICVYEAANKRGQVASSPAPAYRPSQAQPKPLYSQSRDAPALSQPVSQPGHQPGARVGRQPGHPGPLPVPQPVPQPVPVPAVKAAPVYAPQPHYGGYRRRPGSTSRSRGLSRSRERRGRSGELRRSGSGERRRGRSGERRRRRLPLPSRQHRSLAHTSQRSYVSQRPYMPATVRPVLTRPSALEDPSGPAVPPPALRATAARYTQPPVSHSIDADRKEVQRSASIFHRSDSSQNRHSKRFPAFSSQHLKGGSPIYQPPSPPKTSRPTPSSRPAYPRPPTPAYSRYQQKKRSTYARSAFQQPYHPYARPNPYSPYNKFAQARSPYGNRTNGYGFQRPIIPPTTTTTTQAPVFLELDEEVRSSAQIVAEDEANCRRLACRFEQGTACGWRDLQTVRRKASSVPMRLQPPSPGNKGEFCYSGAVLRRGQSAGYLFAPLKLGPLPRVVQIRICELSEGLTLRLCFRGRNGKLRCRLKDAKSIVDESEESLTLSVLLPPGAKQLIIYAINDAGNVGAVGLDYISILHPPPAGAAASSSPLHVCPFFKKKK